VHIVISGFTQRRGNYHGILKLREALIAAGHSRGATRRVWMLPWVANWTHVARDLSIIGVTHGLHPIVTVAGYSYGGYGAVQLCRACERVGIRIASLTLSDPVGRRWWWPRPLPAATSLIGRDMAFRLPISDNVTTVNEFWQERNRPQGHRLILGPSTRRGIYQQLDYRHQEMDDAPEFHECVIDEAGAAWGMGVLHDSRVDTSGGGAG
jgi:pimeloyl-ACP methyl ester carboxylesterase